MNSDETCEYCEGEGCPRCSTCCYECGKPNAQYYSGETPYCEHCYYNEFASIPKSDDELYELWRDRKSDGEDERQSRLKVEECAE